MRSTLLILTLLVGFVPALPSTATAQGIVLAQASKKSAAKADDKPAEETAAEKTADAAKEAEGEANKAADAAQKADEPVENTESDEPAESSERVPLQANFSQAEIITASTAYVGGLALLAFGPNIFGSPDPSLGTPKVGSFDYSLSSRFHGDLVNPGKFLFGIPDYTGLYVLPVGGSLFYLGSAAYYWGTGDTLFGQTENIDHSTMGFVEAVGWTALATGITKQIVGRERPYKALNRPEFNPDGLDSPDSNLSFFSGHTSMSFTFASYVAWDLSDHLINQRGMGWWTGRFLPFAGLYGLASLVGLSRIYDQKHYASDVLTGALVGGLVGNLVYLVHFDEKGKPRIRNPEALGDDVEVSVGPITTVDGSTGVGLIGLW